jgi:hypothetical protein
MIGSEVALKDPAHAQSLRPDGPITWGVGNRVFKLQI